MTHDPNRDRNDPIAPDYWALGEDVQDRIRRAGFESPQVEGIAVDVHDLLQAADRIRGELGPGILAAEPLQLAAALSELADEFEHVRWHCESAIPYLRAAAMRIESV